MFPENEKLSVLNLMGEQSRIWGYAFLRELEYLEKSNKRNKRQRAEGRVLKFRDELTPLEFIERYGTLDYPPLILYENMKHFIDNHRRYKKLIEDVTMNSEHCFVRSETMLPDESYEVIALPKGLIDVLLKQICNSEVLKGQRKSFIKQVKGNISSWGTFGVPGEEIFLNKSQRVCLMTFLDLIGTKVQLNPLNSYQWDNYPIRILEGWEWQEIID